jgi:hypothetical protein
MLVHRFKIHQLIQLLFFLMLQYIGLLSFNSKFCLQMLLSAPLLVLLLKKEYCWIVWTKNMLKSTSSLITFCCLENKKSSLSTFKCHVKGKLSLVSIIRSGKTEMCLVKKIETYIKVNVFEIILKLFFVLSASFRIHQKLRTL